MRTLWESCEEGLKKSTNLQLQLQNLADMSVLACSDATSQKLELSDTGGPITIALPLRQKAMHGKQISLDVKQISVNVFFITIFKSFVQQSWPLLPGSPSHFPAGTWHLEQEMHGKTMNFINILQIKKYSIKWYGYTNPFAQKWYKQQKVRIVCLEKLTLGWSQGYSDLPEGKSGYPRDHPWGNFSRQPLRTFRYFSHFSKDATKCTSYCSCDESVSSCARPVHAPVLRCMHRCTSAPALRGGVAWQEAGQKLWEGLMTENLSKYYSAYLEKHHGS